MNKGLWIVLLAFVMAAGGEAFATLSLMNAT
jgi:hypothetical protein